MLLNTNKFRVSEKNGDTAKMSWPILNALTIPNVMQIGLRAGFVNSVSYFYFSFKFGR